MFCRVDLCDFQRTFSLREEMDPLVFSLIFFLASIIIMGTSPAHACTLWGSVEKSADGASVSSCKDSAWGRPVPEFARHRGKIDGKVVFAKNRDWAYKDITLTKIFKPQKGFRYFGIFGDKDGKSTGVKAGINEKGLVVLSATASSLHKKERIYRGKDKIAINGYVLSHYSNVDEVLNNKKIFSRCNPAFVVVGDRNKAAVVEVAPGGKYSYKIVNKGVFCHTNHYFQEPDFDKFNRKPAESSRVRLKRIRSLLESKDRGWRLEDFIGISKNEEDGPDNSLWRKGSSPKESRTLATFIVEIPENGFPVVYIRRADFGKPVEERRFVIDGLFWDGDLEKK